MCGVRLLEEEKNKNFEPANYKQLAAGMARSKGSKKKKGVHEILLCIRARVSGTVPPRCRVVVPAKSLFTLKGFVIVVHVVLYMVEFFFNSFLQRTDHRRTSLLLSRPNWPCPSHDQNTRKG